jgi:hypothetical protein
MPYLIAGTCYRGECTGLPARRFINEWLCGEHAPPNPEPDPEHTVTALRHVAELRRRMLRETRKEPPRARPRPRRR